MTRPSVLTAVDLAHYPERLSYWLRFGEAWETVLQDRRRARAYFEPGSLACYIRWWANEYGTQSWKCFVLRAVGPGMPAVAIPGVHPGAELLLAVRGTTYSQRFLEQLDVLEADGIAPETVSPAYWRYLGNKVFLNVEPHAYGGFQGRAWHLMQRTFPCRRT